MACHRKSNFRLMQSIGYLSAGSAVIYLVSSLEALLEIVTVLANIVQKTCQAGLTFSIEWLSKFGGQSGGSLQMFLNRLHALSVWGKMGKP